MIDRTLSPVRCGVSSDWGEHLQAFAMTYLAFYASLPEDAGSTESYKRGWGFDSVGFIPRVDGGRPGAAWAVILYPWGYHLIIGIEGSTSPLRQTFSWTTGSNGFVPLVVRPGLVWGTAKNYADAFLTLLNANPFAIYLAERTTRVTIAGFSLGGAVSEILAEQLAAAKPYLTVCNHKFGTPRFYDREYLQNRTSRILRAHTLVERDPIANIPESGIAFTGSSFASLPYGFAFAPMDPDRQRFNYRGEPIHTRFETGGVTRTDLVSSPFEAYRALLNPITSNNPWYWHNQHRYRQMFMNIAARESDLLPLRFNYLTHPDENNWQTVFRPGIDNIPDPVIIDPAPEAFRALTSAQMRLSHQPVQVTTQAPQPEELPISGGGGVFGGEPDASLIPNWGAVDPAVSTRRRQRRRGVMQ